MPVRNADAFLYFVARPRLKDCDQRVGRGKGGGGSLLKAVGVSDDMPGAEERPPLFYSRLNCSCRRPWGCIKVMHDFTPSSPMRRRFSTGRNAATLTGRGQSGKQRLQHAAAAALRSLHANDRRSSDVCAKLVDIVDETRIGRPRVET